MRLAFALCLFACGAPATPVENVTRQTQTEEQRGPTPFPRLSALPAAPAVVVEIDMTALRETSLYENMREAMSGDAHVDLLGRRVIERAERVTIGTYGEDRALVMIARGPLEGLLAGVIADLSRGGMRVSHVERLGFTAYYIDDDLVAAQTAADTIVLSFPQFIDEVLRTAAGEAPATPLPTEMRALLDRPIFEGAPMRMVFSSRTNNARDDALSALVRDARFAGIAGRFEAGQIVATGTARASSDPMATRLATSLEQFARGTTDADVDSQTLGRGIRESTVRVEDRWIELTLRFPPQDVEAFMRIVGPLGGI